MHRSGGHNSSQGGRGGSTYSSRGGGGGGGSSNRRGGQSSTKGSQPQHHQQRPNQTHARGQKRQRDQDEDEQVDEDQPKSTSDEFNLERALQTTDTMDEDEEADGPNDYQQLLAALRGGSANNKSTPTASASSNPNSLTAQHAALLRKRAREEQGREDEESDDDEEDGEPEYEEVEIEVDSDGNEIIREDEDDEDQEDGEEDDENMDEGEDDENEEVEEDGEDEEEAKDENAPKRRKLKSSEATEEDGEDDDDEDDDETGVDLRGPIDGDDVLSDDEDDKNGTVTAEEELAAEMKDSDLFVRKFSHAHTFTPQQVAALSVDATQYSKSCPFRKAPAVPGLKEMLFVAGDVNTITPEPTATPPEQQLTSKKKSSSAPSKSPVALTPSDRLLPSHLLTPERSISSASFHLRSKLVESWQRQFVEPERRKLLKKAKKSATSSSTTNNNQSTEEDEQKADEAESETLIAKEEALTPATTKYCSPDCICYLCSDFYSPFQSSLLSMCTSYKDIVLTQCTPFISKSVHEVLALHCMNHLTKSRERVLKHSQEISKYEEQERERKEEDRRKKKEWREAMQKAKQTKTPVPPAPVPSEPIPIPEYHDQGFTRPKVVALFPTAKVAYEFVLKLLKILPAKAKHVEMKRKRFDTDFATTPDDHCHPEKPFEYKYYFDGKDNDAFRCGISFGQKSVKYFTPFYSADLIIASPLGLRMITGSVGDKVTEREYDFLSSVEVLCVDSFDVCSSMQNYQHLQTIMDVLNIIPYETKHTDFSRVREWNLSGHGKYHRQTIILSAHPSLELQHFQKVYARNAEGKVQFRLLYPGILSRVIPQVKQIFQRIHCEKLTELGDCRFDYFTTIVLPQLKTSYPSGHILIYIPSYYDYVRLRNYSKQKHLSVTYASEYTKNSALSRGRSEFFHGNVKFMLLTERFHFFKRYQIRGIKHLIFYSLPTYQQFYVDFLNLLPSDTNSTSGEVGTSMALFSKFDTLELERIIGTQRAKKLIEAQNQTHMFC